MFICSCLAGSAQLLVDGQLYRAVVGSEDFGVDLCICESDAKVIANYKVVNTPAGVLLTGLEPV